MKLKHYNSALILGMGVSGIAAAELLLNEGTSVVMIDSGDGDHLRDSADWLFALGADVHLGVDSLGDLLDMEYRQNYTFDVCIVSPGIAPDDPWLGVVKLQKNISIISELELGASRLHLPMVAVTGSNGKSTFVKLCGDMFIQNGLKPALAGNYGLPLCQVAMEQDKYDWAVVEVSSFQLEHVVDFHPDIVVIMNIEPDHLDRHGNMKTYMSLKSKIFNRMTDDNLALVYDKIINEIKSLTSGSPTWKSFGCSKESDYHYSDGVIEGRVADNALVLDLHETIFANEITGLTAAAVFAVSEHLSFDIKNMKKALVEFESLPHRMQVIGEHNGVVYIDDSKATNIAALQAALTMMSRPIHLIVGGQLKETDISKPEKLLKQKVKAVYCIGESELVFATAWKNVAKCYLSTDLAGAVDKAQKNSEPGDVILLSPGCASFDQFSNYKERGNQFQRLVNSL